MKNFTCIIFLFLTTSICNSQNLIPNGDFEQYHSCPDDISELDSALYWFTPTDGTSDYYNQCATSNLVGVPDNGMGHQVAHSGVGYSGIFFYDDLLGFSLNYREYLEVQLTSALTAGNCYRFQMYMSLSELSAYAVSDIEVHFSSGPVTNFGTQAPLLVTPQIVNTGSYITDTVNWVTFAANYTANGTETHIVIGSFKDDSMADTLFVNANTGIEHFAYYYIDDVSLMLCTGVEEQNYHQEINSFPNPFNDGLNFSCNSNSDSQVIIYDIASRIIFNGSFTSSIHLNTSQFSKGIYMYEIRNEDVVVKKGKLIKQ